MTYFYIVNFDGFNVGLRGSFYDTYLEFDSIDEAKMIATHWDKWIKGEIEL